jgi:acetyl esterase/lipase
MASPEYQKLLKEWTTHERPQTLDLATLRDWMADAPLPPPEVASVNRIEAAGIPGEWVTAPGASPVDRLLYLHGGGYVSGSAAAYRPFTATLSRITGCSVLAIDYRLGPENPFPAAVDDAVDAFQWMLRFGPAARLSARSTFLAGDSAGGGLTFAAMLAMRDAGLPLPNAAVAICPYADLAHTGESVQSRAATDVINRPSWLSLYADNYLAGASPYHPLASPLYGNPAGLPPLLIQVGDAEIIRDDSTRFAKKAKACGVDVTLEVWPEMMHVWHIREPSFPEARDATAAIARFVQDHRGHHSTPPRHDKQ